jgi:polyisoprenoid-binding protein YceI
MLPQLRIHRRVICLSFLVLLCAGFAQAEQKTFELDPAQTKVSFTLDSTLHTVHGTFHLKRGRIQFDPATGQAGGELLIDATSGESGSNGRDKRMHKDILESTRYPDIVFTPQRLKGTVAMDGKSQVDVEGLLTLHGQSRPLTLTIQLQLQGGAGTADTEFSVPYQQWGMKNPSTFILRVSDKVELHVHAMGRFLAESHGLSVRSGSDRDVLFFVRTGEGIEGDLEGGQRDIRRAAHQLEINGILALGATGEQLLAQESYLMRQTMITVHNTIDPALGDLVTTSKLLLCMLHSVAHSYQTKFTSFPHQYV